MPVSSELVARFVSLFKSLEKDLSVVEELMSLVKDVNVYLLKFGGKGVDVVASDSSRVVKKFRVAVVFAVQATGVKFGSKSVLVNDAVAGYSIASPASGFESIDDIVKRVAMFLSRELEVLMVEKLVNEGEVALFDGSVFTFLWYAKHPEIPETLVFSGRERPGTVRDIWRSTATVLSNVVEKAWAVFIAKTIRRSYYINKILQEQGVDKVVNDIILLDLLKKRGSLPREPHFIEPIYIENVKDLPRPLANLDEEDVRYIEKLLPITITYTTFSPRAPPYQVTVPGKLSAEELREILSSLAPYTSSGYPDPLRVAHARCRLSWRELSLLLAKAGFVLPSGRELLGEFM
jgi:hypothetical protein